MTILDRDIAELCNGIYEYAGDIPVSWGHLDIGQDDGVYWAVKRLADDGGPIDVLVYRGSTTIEDFKRDAEALADPFDGGNLGPVHPGFQKGLDQAVNEFLLLAGPRVIVAGHSLGAGRASIATGYLVQAGRVPIARVVFGEPRPGFKTLAKYIGGVPGRSYRNGSGDGLHYDLVTAVPFCAWPEEYVHPTRLIDVCAPPPANDPWGPLSWHHMPLYLQALRG